MPSWPRILLAQRSRRAGTRLLKTVVPLFMAEDYSRNQQLASPIFSARVVRRIEFRHSGFGGFPPQRSAPARSCSRSSSCSCSHGNMPPMHTNTTAACFDRERLVAYQRGIPFRPDPEDFSRSARRGVGAISDIKRKLGTGRARARAGAGNGGRSGYAAGSSTRKVVPLPGSLWTSILPRWASTMVLQWNMPMPRPFFLVV